MSRSPSRLGGVSALSRAPLIDASPAARESPFTTMPDHTTSHELCRRWMLRMRESKEICHGNYLRQRALVLLMSGGLAQVGNQMCEPGTSWSTVRECVLQNVWWRSAARMSIASRCERVLRFPNDVAGYERSLREALRAPVDRGFKRSRGSNRSARFFLERASTCGFLTEWCVSPEKKQTLEGASSTPTNPPRSGDANLQSLVFSDHARTMKLWHRFEQMQDWDICLFQGVPPRSAEVECKGGRLGDLWVAAELLYLESNAPDSRFIETIVLDASDDVLHVWFGS